MDNNRLKQQYNNFARALKRLEEVLELPKEDEIVLDATIQRFEFTYELSWKLMKLYLEDQGIVDVCHTPKMTVKEAFKREVIHDGQGWIDMIGDRNRTSHIYNQSMARRIYNNINDKYIRLFRELREFMEY